MNANNNHEVLAGFVTVTRVDRVVSDGQPGAARGALDAAIALGISHGGACPADRLADDGELDKRYEMHACPGGFGERCARNIRGSDGTLLFSFCIETEIDGRTAHARDHAKKKHKASAHVRLFADQEPAERMAKSIRLWIDRCKVRTLHVTGPLERMEPGIAEATKRMLHAVLGKAPS